MSVLARVKDKALTRKEETLSFQDFLDLCKTDKMAYANAAERLLAAIGEPNIVDTSDDRGRLGRIFQGEKIAIYPGFSGFYGMEETIDKIVTFLKGAARGGEESKQILYLLGPVGGGKSSLGERIKQLAEVHPIYVLRSKATGQISPVFDNPLSVFADDMDLQGSVKEEYGIAGRYMRTKLSPWAVKRLEEAGGDPEAAFEVVKIYPSRAHQRAIAKVEPGDENNQDISTLVGKVNLNELGEGLNQNDTDAYLYSGGLNAANRGVMEFVEMFKAPIKTLHPLLEALQSRAYLGTENIGEIPFEGVIIAHSNESEWAAFSSNKNNEAFLDRVCMVKVPYTLRHDEERRIYEKQVTGEAYADAPIAPKTLEILSKFAVMARIIREEGLAKYSPALLAQVANGEIPAAADDKTLKIAHFYDELSTQAGMGGVSTRWAFKVLTRTFNYRSHDGEIAADPLTLMEVLEETIKQDDSLTNKDRLLELISKHLMPEYTTFLSKEIMEAFVSGYGDLCQNMFDNYIAMANAWVDDDYYTDPTTKHKLSKADLEAKLKEIEAPAKIGNPKDFRAEVTRYVNRKKAENEPVTWNSYEKMASVIRANLAGRMKDLLPIISISDPLTEDADKSKRSTFLEGMKAKGYTQEQIYRIVAHYQKVKPSLVQS